MLSVVRGGFRSCINSHGNYIFYHGKSWKSHGIVLLNFCGNPVLDIFLVFVVLICFCCTIYILQLFYLILRKLYFAVSYFVDLCLKPLIAPNKNTHQISVFYSKQSIDGDVALTKF